MQPIRSDRKGKKNLVIIRLYRQFDIDLIYLFETLYGKYDNGKQGKKHPDGSESTFQTIFKDVLRSCIYGKKKSAEVQKIINKLLHPNEEQELIFRYKRQYHLILYEESDADILAWLEQFSTGYRNTAIKLAVRSYLGEPCFYPCLKKTNIKFTENRKGETT